MARRSMACQIIRLTACVVPATRHGEEKQNVAALTYLMLLTNDHRKGASPEDEHVPGNVGAHGARMQPEGWRASLCDVYLRTLLLS